MSWRQQLPVHSPISIGGLLSGVGAATGLLPSRHNAVAASIARTFGARRTVLTDSGTSALVLAIRALVPAGGTIALPGYGCIDLSAAVLFAGVRARLYDLDPSTLSPDLDSLRRALSRGVDAIVVAHLYGYPADVPAVRALAAQHGACVIDDAAQGAGSTMHGIRSGGLGDLGVLSFGRGKGTTGGSGGALLVTNDAHDSAVEKMSSFGAPPLGGRTLVPLAAQWVLGRPALYRLPSSIPALKLGEMVYHPAHEPRALSHTSAAVLAGALERDDDEIRARRERADWLRTLVGASQRFRAVRVVRGGEAGYLRFAVVGPSSNVTPDVSIGALRGYPLTLEQHEPLRGVLHEGERAGAGSRTLRDQLFTLPTHSLVSRADVARCGRWLDVMPVASDLHVSANGVA
jgi:perosamine synthetase